MVSLLMPSRLSSTHSFFPILDHGQVLVVKQTVGHRPLVQVTRVRSSWSKGREHERNILSCSVAQGCKFRVQSFGWGGLVPIAHIKIFLAVGKRLPLAGVRRKRVHPSNPTRHRLRSSPSPPKTPNLCLPEQDPLPWRLRLFENQRTLKANLKLQKTTKKMHT